MITQLVCVHDIVQDNTILVTITSQAKTFRVFTDYSTSLLKSYIAIASLVTSALGTSCVTFSPSAGT